MLNRQADPSKHRGARPGMIRRGGRWAAWLLSGWAAFWLATAVQACGAGATPQPLSGNTAAPASGRTEQPGFPERQGDPAFSCRLLAAPAVVVTAAVAAVAGRFDPVTPAPAAAAVRIAWQPAYAPNRAPSRLGLAPLPPVPLYLRNRRFLT